MAMLLSFVYCCCGLVKSDIIIIFFVSLRLRIVLIVLAGFVAQGCVRKLFLFEITHNLELA